jgi:monoamine oxidase
VTGAPVLVAFTNGQAAATQDRYASDEQVVARGMSVLRRMFGNSVPDPVGYLYPRWLSDPWAMGSYTYPAVGNRDSDRTTYGEPVGNRLYFAGEGTRLLDNATVHGALNAGEAVACRIFLDHVGTETQVIAPWGEAKDKG